jgi:hypothetical protein
VSSPVPPLNLPLLLSADPNGKMPVSAGFSR